MLNFEASKPRVKGGPLDPRLGIATLTHSSSKLPCGSRGGGDGGGLRVFLDDWLFDHLKLPLPSKWMRIWKKNWDFRFDHLNVSPPSRLELLMRYFAIAEIVKGVTTSTSYEYELWVSENKVQLTRIRDENGKFRSNSVSILNITFA